MKSIISLILGGGQGSRLFPLTKERSKPAVPIGGKYRLIDIPITNSLRSDINRIFIVTQFNSESLNKHIAQTYRFDNFHKGFVNILAAEQTISTNDWFQGTADAVRKNLKHIFQYRQVKHVLVLSGDHIYKMNYRKLFEYHKKNNFEISVCVKPVSKNDAGAFGIMKIKDKIITDFIEKPKNENVLNEFNAYDMISKCYDNIPDNKQFLGNMGIYLFNADTLLDMLDNNYTDFGKEVIPNSIKRKKVGAYFFEGYWEDVGTIKTFLKANLDFTAPVPEFNLYDRFIYTHARFLPPSKVVHCNIDEALLSEGIIIQNSTIRKSIIGIRSIIRNNVTIEGSMIMGADYYETEEDLEENRENNVLNIGIGDNTVIRNAIIDKNSRIGSNCKIINKDNIENYDGENYCIRDYIVIVPKNSIIPDNTEI